MDTSIRNTYVDLQASDAANLNDNMLQIGYYVFNNEDDNDEDQTFDLDPRFGSIFATQISIS